MNLSQRIKKLKPSPTLALNAKAQTLKAQGAKVFNFAVGEPDFPTPRAIVEKGLESLKAGRTKYGPAGGGKELKEAISQKLLRENNLSFTPDQVVVGIGAKEILFHTFLSILNDSDEVVLPAPCWVSYADQVLAGSGVPKLIPWEGNLGANEPFSLGALEKTSSARTTALVLTSPNNPTGYIYKEGFLRQLGDFLKKKNWWIISDEIYEYLAFDTPHISLLNVCPELKDRFILINGLSKGFAMTGWRVGYGAGPLEVMKMVRGLEGHSSTCVPGFIEDAATLALTQGKAIMKEEIQKLRQRRDLAVGLVKDIPRSGFFPPEGAFYIYLDVRSYLGNGKFKELDSFSLSEWLLEKYHLALVPGEAFGTPGFLRISYCLKEDDLKQGILTLKKALSEI